MTPYLTIMSKEPVKEDLESEPLEDTEDDTPSDEVDEDTTEDEEQVEDEVEDETEEDDEDLDDDSEEETDAEVLDISDTDTTQVIRLADGTEITFQNLIDGQMMQKDYTVKTQALAEERKELDELKLELSGKVEMYMSEHESILNQWNEELVEAREQFRLEPTSHQAKQRYDVAQVNTDAAKLQFETTEATHFETKKGQDLKRIQDADAYAGENIKGWTQDYATDLLSYAQEVTGVSGAELAPFINGATLVLLDKAHKFDKGAVKASNKRTLAKKKGRSLKQTASKSKKSSISKKDARSKEAIDKYAETGDFNDLNDIFPDDFVNSF